MVIPTIDKEQTLTPNNLQFQPGLSLSEFLRDYGTQAQCEAALEKTRRPAGYLLPSVSERQPRHRLAWQGQDLPVQPLPYPGYPNRRDDLSCCQIVVGIVGIGSGQANTLIFFRFIEIQASLLPLERIFCRQKTPSKTFGLPSFQQRTPGQSRIEIPSSLVAIFSLLCQ